MSKCGKGCLPECEYFTTGGCISPFNCMYKEESGYINSATSGTVIYTGGMNMPDEKMIENLKCVIADISEQCELLKAENAALRERLEKAVELPFAIGDMAYYCDYIEGKGYVIIEREIVGIKQIKNEPKWWDKRESFMVAIVQGKKQDYDEIGEWYYDIGAFGAEWGIDRAAAEKRLAELKGDSK